jgi:hypothetical protein
MYKHWLKERYKDKPIVNAESLSLLNKSTKEQRTDLSTPRHLGQIPRIRIMKTILHLNLYGEHFANIIAGTKKTEYRDCSPFWRSRLTNRKYDLIQIRNGYATNAPEMLIEFRGCRIQGRGPNKKFSIRLGRILELKRWKQ